MSDLPIACTLTAHEARDRAELVRRLFADALIERRATRAGMRGRFRDSAGVERRLRDLVAAEAVCCPFLSFNVARENGELWLEVTSAPEGRRVIEQLFAGA
jgi:hypothetical protein